MNLASASLLIGLANSAFGDFLLNREGHNREYS
jgi:uncharacterized membrane protein YhhN